MVAGLKSINNAIEYYRRFKNIQERKNAENALMNDLVPQLKKLAQGREISGLAAYE